MRVDGALRVDEVDGVDGVDGWGGVRLAQASCRQFALETLALLVWGVVVVLWLVVVPLAALAWGVWRGFVWLDENVIGRSGA